MALGPAEIAHGPMFIGVMINMMLYGITITQTFLYFTTYKKDRTWMKIFVIFIFVADTANSIFDLVYLYDALIIHFADVPFLQRANWVFATDPVLTGIIAFPVQLFYTWRVKVLTENTFVVVAILATSSASFLSSLASAIAVGIVPQFANFLKFKVVVIIWLLCAAVADIIITVALVWHLKKHKTGFPATDDLVNRVIRVTVQTGLATSLWATCDLIFYLSIPTGLHLIFNMPLSKLYTNSLLSSLNSRGGWRLRNVSKADTGLPRPVSLAFAEIGGRATTTRPEVFVHAEQPEVDDNQFAEGDANADARSDKTGDPAKWDGSQGTIV